MIWLASTGAIAGILIGTIVIVWPVSTIRTQRLEVWQTFVAQPVASVVRVTLARAGEAYVFFRLLSVHTLPRAVTRIRCITGAIIRIAAGYSKFLIQTVIIAVATAAVGCNCTLVEAPTLLPFIGKANKFAAPTAACT
jgi:hypothetical protein